MRFLAFSLLFAYIFELIHLFIHSFAKIQNNALVIAHV